MQRTNLVHSYCTQRRFLCKVIGSSSEADNRFVTTWSGLLQPGGYGKKKITCNDIVSYVLQLVIFQCPRHHQLSGIYAALTSINSVDRAHPWKFSFFFFILTLRHCKRSSSLAFAAPCLHCTALQGAVANLSTKEAGVHFPSGLSSDGLLWLEMVGRLPGKCGSFNFWFHPSHTS